MQVDLSESVWVSVRDVLINARISALIIPRRDRINIDRAIISIDDGVAEQRLLSIEASLD
jgi:hypothetical protein